MSENNRRFVPLAKSVVIEYVEITGSVPKNATVITKTSIPTGSNINPSEEFIKITSTNKVYRLVAKQPSIYDSTNKPNGIKFGEVAVNFKQDFEALFISNNSNDILKFTPIKEEIDLYETSQKAATTMAVNEFVLPVEVTYTPSATLSYAVNENEVYFPSSSTGISTLNLTVNAHNLNQDFVRPATFYFKTGSNGCTVNLLGAALDGVYGVADPSNIRLIENSTYRIIVKDKRAFIECAIPVLSRVGHGDGITFRNVADTQDKETLDGGGIIKLKTATTTEKGGVKVYSTKNTSVSAATTPTSPKTNRDYGLEVGGDDKAYVYVPWEDTKNTAGTMNTSDKIYIVGSKTKATTAANDNKQTNTNGENYIDGDGWLCTDGQKVAIQKDVNEINDLLEILEQWPTITHAVNVKSGDTQPTVTISSLPDLKNKFIAQQNGNVSPIQITSNNQAVKVGSTIKPAVAISVTDKATFNPSGSSITITGKTTLSGFTNGYRTTISGDITQSQSFTASGRGAAQITQIDKSKTADSTLTLAYNGGEVVSVNNASANTNITIPTTVTVTSNLGKGLNTIKLTYHNPSSISRGDADYTIPEIKLYNVSSLNRSNDAHLEIEGENTSGCPGLSTTAADKTVTLNVYGAFPIFSTTSEGIITVEADAKSTYNTGSTTNVDTNKNYFFNYYTTSSIVLYFLFGSIPNGAANSNAKIFLPVNNDTGCNLRITEIQGFNAVAQNWSVPMTLTESTNDNVDGRTYKQYIISDSASAGQGPNAYRVAISR